MTTVTQMAPAVGIVALCVALGVSRATVHRRRARVATANAAAAPAVAPTTPGTSQEAAIARGGLGPLASCQGTEGASVPPQALEGNVEPVAARAGHAAAGVVEPPAATPARKPQGRALSVEERQNAHAVLVEERFFDQSPAEICATLLDEGRYLCSERTMYRILDENREVRERRNQRIHPVYTAPERMAEKPNQLWSWDITKLKTMVKSSYFHLYVILDVFSRYVVGWLVADRESGELAKELIDETCLRHNIPPGQLTFHADNGSAMIAQPVATLLVGLGVTKSHSRPHVSNDNPFSESAFKTLKYRPDFPERFVSLEHARAFLRHFFAWYNTAHHHVGLALLTPHDVHHGLANERLAHRSVVLDAAYAAHPERFVNRPPRPRTLPLVVWINPPKEPNTPQPLEA